MLPKRAAGWPLLTESLRAAASSAEPEQVWCLGCCLLCTFAFPPSLHADSCHRQELTHKREEGRRGSERESAGARLGSQQQYTALTGRARPKLLLLQTCKNKPRDDAHAMDVMTDTVTPEDEDFPGRLLHQAALWDNAELLEDLLRGEQAGHIDSQDSWGRTPLHAAATTESSRCLRVLLAAGANPNIPCGPRGENRNPLHVSCEHGCVNNVRTLLEYGAKLGARDGNSRTALDLAEAADHQECMQVLQQVAAGAMHNAVERLWAATAQIVDTVEAETAFEACSYFVDDVTQDEKERTRQEQHRALREACSRGDASLVRELVRQLANEAELVINMAPSGSNTLLFTACEVGQKEIVKILLENEADGRIHPVTKYSPLYIACYYGRKDVVEMLLRKFPELVQQHTVEKWLPIHASCINGHVAVLELLLKFAYPLHVLLALRDKTAEWQYSLPFDLNARDVTGQSVLYLACYLGNQALVDLLLKFKVKATRIKSLEEKDVGQTEQDDEQKATDLLSPTRRRISNGIQSIMSKLNLSRQEATVKNETQLSPLLLDLYCNNNTETALHVAVKCRHHSIISALLLSGSNPNLPILANEEELSREEDVLGQGVAGSTALVEACRNRDLTTLDLLLKYGARDDDCRALAVASASKDEIMAAKLLATKAHADPEYKINKKAMAEISPAQFACSSGLAAGLGSLTYGSLFPNTAVMVNWHGQQSLAHIRPQWLVDAALTVNSKLRLNPRHQDVVLYSITRLDVSKNSLRTLPIVIFQLQSLRYLNVAQNKIEKLPSNAEKSSIPLCKSNKGRVISETTGYNAPVLEEIHLQDNRLEQIPEELFQLPALVSLDISNNKLQTLPYKMWKAPKLKEMNAAFNLLRDLPTHQQEVTVGLEPLLDADLASPDHTSAALRLGSQSPTTGQPDILTCPDASEDVGSLVDDLQDAHALQLLHSNAKGVHLRSMGHITSYPGSLKQLDLSHNQICCWPSLPQVEALDAMEQAHIACYAPAEGSSRPTKIPILAGRRTTGHSLRSIILSSVCVHRRHLRLDNLRTLVLADNRLARIQLATDDDGASSVSEDDDQDDQLRDIPHNIHELTNLSVLNISGNSEINELPPQMGLLSRLWNLNTRGCSLQEPLKSMIDSKKYKTMDVIGYLKSVLEDARPYARMKLMIVGVQGIGKTSLLEQLRSKELLLEQRVPASYVALEDVVSHLASERRAAGADPVLSGDQYRAKVAHEMQLRFHRTFRDAAELNQATAFLHENGVLLHYDDATLKDLYFLDPQWLCDMLAHVVTIREINPFARTGVMKLDDLKHVFKSSSYGPVDTRGYIVNLLNKFEVALTWDSRTLLIPSLLPSEEQFRTPHLHLPQVRIPVRSRGWAVRSKKTSMSHASTIVGNSSFYTSGETFRLQKPTPKGASAVASPKISAPSLPLGEHQVTSPDLPRGELPCEVTCRPDPEAAVRRLLLMSYFPSGFWSRLITRILADDTIVEIVRSYLITPKEVSHDPSLAQLLDQRAEWLLWQTGMELRYFDTTLFRMKEVLPSLKHSPVDYRQLSLFILAEVFAITLHTYATKKNCARRFQLRQEGTWADVDMNNSSILELYFPAESLVIRRRLDCEADEDSYQAIVLDPSPECMSKLLALAVDHIDILLEDWYPTLGTRFVHTSEGRFLVTRLVPCPRCLATSTTDSESTGRPDDCDTFLHKHVAEAFGHSLQQLEIRAVRKSQESYTSDGDSGVGPDSTGSSRTTSVEGHPLAGLECSTGDTSEAIHFSWLVEECILAAYDKKTVTCPAHGDLGLPQMFQDLGERHLIRPENIKRGKLLGRGAFGFVFRGSCKLRGSSLYMDVAMKMLQPVQPGPNARQSAMIAYKAAQGKWERDPLQYACKAYCTARQELNILLSLRHPNIVPLVGICTRPLALVLDLAPQGALDMTLRHYRRSGAKFGPYILQAIILQVAKAIEYLHQQHIIYRDLKSENVLVWEMPPPFETDPKCKVHVKLADYGISRLTLPSGTKGFGGTEGFMAPEIMRYNGEEEYTEKVDCFSFGMFIYELLTLHQPFEGHESVKECILEGGRPSLTYRETLYPGYILDLMVLCWAQQPRDRPSASQIVSIASAPEFPHLADVVSLSHAAVVSATAVVPLNQVGDEGLPGSELWLGCLNARADMLLATCGRGWSHYCSLALPGNPTAACAVGPNVWLGDHKGQLHALSASDCTLLFSYTMEPDAPQPCPVVALLALPSLQRVAVALANGRLFMVRSDVLPTAPTKGEGSFVMTELGNSAVLHAVAAVYRDNEVCELWCGESHGNISIFSIRDSVVSSQQVVNHYEPVIENLEVLHLISSHTPYSAGQHPAVWSYVYPGCVVYHWDPAQRTILHKLDCSKLVPCSESLKSISIEEHLSPGRCQ
ncbi:hypothetical protein B566_EDAN014882, partial [Ephemera danica]